MISLLLDNNYVRDYLMEFLEGQRKRFLLSPWFFLIGCFILCGCSDSEPPSNSFGDLEIVEPFIDQDPYDVFDLQSFQDLHELFAWTFDDETAFQGWSTRDPADMEVRNRALIVQASKAQIQLTRHTNFDAESVDALQLEVSGLRKGKVQMFWAGPGQNFDQGRRLTLYQEDTQTAEKFTFFLSSHPQWKGRIARLRFTLSPVADRVLRLTALRAYDSTVDHERLKQASAHPWKIDLGGDVRSGFLATPGGTISRAVELPENAFLHFGFSNGTQATPISFHLYVQTLDGHQKEVFRRRAAPADTFAPAAWQDVSVDLAPWSGQKVLLILKSESDKALDLTEGIPFWSQPILLKALAEDRRPNIVLISIDTLRADHLSLYGYGRETSPQIDAWAKHNAVTFLNTVAPAPWTLPSHVSLFTGMDALSHGLNYGNPAPASAQMLAERLGEAGYFTAAITGGVYLHPRYGLHQGFGRFSYWPSEKDQSEELLSGISAALDFIAAPPAKPFFLFFHTYEVHSPFDARQPFYNRLAESASFEARGARLATRIASSTDDSGFQMQKEYIWKKDKNATEFEKLPQSELQTVSDLYDSGIAYTDSQIGRLLNALSGYDDDTIIVLTSDHGEALGERGFAAHSYLYDFNLMVPLIISLPGKRGAGKLVSAQVRLVDVFPTLLQLAELHVPEGIDGTPLLALIDTPSSSFPREAWSYAASTNYGISLRFSNQLKYIYNSTALHALHGTEELYRLAEDPTEQQNLAPGSPIELERLRERMFEHYVEKFRGLELEISNSYTVDYRLHLGPAKFLSPTKINATLFPSKEAAWRGKDGFMVDIPAKASFSIFVEAVDPQARMELVLKSLQGDARCRFPIDVESLHGPLGMLLIDGSCRTVQEEPEKNQGISIILHLRQESQELLAAPTDSTLREKLEALGYIN